MLPPTPWAASPDLVSLLPPFQIWRAGVGRHRVSGCGLPVSLLCFRRNKASAGGRGTLGLERSVGVSLQSGPAWKRIMCHPRHYFPSDDWYAPGLAAPGTAQGQAFSFTGGFSLLSLRQRAWNQHPAQTCKEHTYLGDYRI